MFEGEEGEGRMDCSLAFVSLPIFHVFPLEATIKRNEVGMHLRILRLRIRLNRGLEKYSHISYGLVMRMICQRYI